MGLSRRISRAAARRALSFLVAIALGLLLFPAGARAQVLLPPDVVARLQKEAGGKFNVSELLSRIRVDDFREVGTLRSGTIRVYNATIPASYDSRTDIAEFRIEGTGIRFLGDVDDLDDFVKRNAEDILRALFPNLDGGFQGTTASQRSALTLSQTALLPPLEPPGRRRARQEEEERRLRRLQEEARTPEERERVGAELEALRFVRRDLAGMVGFDRFTVGPARATGNTFSGVLGYRSEGRGWEWGAVVPYSFTDVDDVLRTQAHALEVGAYLAWIALRDPLVLKAGLSVLGHASVFDTVLGTGGFLRYGAGPYLTAERQQGPFSVGVLVGYQVSEVSIPVVKDELVDALRARDPDQELYYGLRVGVTPLESLAVNVGAIRTRNFNGDVSRDFNTSTSLFASVSLYFTNTFELTVGYRKVLEVRELTSDGGFLGFIYRF